MTLAQLRALLTVVEAGSFTAAGARLHLTQSGISHAVTSLEAEVGVRLMHRRRDGIELTPAGERILALARQMLTCEEHIRQEAVSVKAATVEGRVRLGTLPSVSARLLPRLLATLKRQHPGMEVVLFEGSDAEVLGWLQARAVDVGIVALPVKGLETVALVTDEMLVVVPASHALATRASVSAAAVAPEPFIMSQGGCEPLIRAVFRRAGKSPRVRYAVRETATILGMVREGLGVTVLPRLALPTHHPGVRAVPFAPSVPRPLALAVHSQAAAPPAVQAFIREAVRGAAVVEQTVRIT